MHVPPTADIAVDPPTCTNMIAPTENNKETNVQHSNASCPATASTPRRTSTSACRQSSSSGKSGGGTKNSSDKERGSVLKVVECIAMSFENGAVDGGESAGQLAMMMMMQQQSQAQMQAQVQQQQQLQQFQSMQQLQLQQFQQSMQNQTSEMDHWAN